MFNRLTRLGAKPVVERGEGDDQNEWGYVRLSFPLLDYDVVSKGDTDVKLG